MNLLTRIQHDTAGLYRQVSRNARDCGPEFAGPCPFCGGRDRFHIWPEHPRGARAWCRQCEKSMDEIQYLRDRHSMSYAEALAALGRETAIPAAATTPKPPEPCEPPPADWQAHYNELVLEWASALWGDYTGPLDYLHQRGFSDETLIRAAIGYKATSSNDEQWGWLPRGIVIPVYIGAALWQVKVRRSDKDIARDEAAGRKRGKYINARGPANPLYNADAIRPGRPVCLVEGYFDALAIQQQAGDLITPVAAGSTTGARHFHWYLALQRCPVILQAFDADEEGDTAAPHWLGIFKQRAIRWRPYLHDPAQMLEDGMDIRQWISTGLQTAQSCAA